MIIRCLLTITLGSLSFGASQSSASSSINELYENLIKSNLDVTLDPCDDFYAYACSNWHENHSHNGSEYIDMPGYLDYQVNRQLKHLMENLTQFEWSTGVHKKAQELYDLCCSLDFLVLNPFLQWVHKDLHMEWPIFEMGTPKGWQNSTNFDWVRTVAVLRNYGLNFLFISQHVNINPRNSSEFIVEISQHLPTNSFDSKDVESVFNSFGLPTNESHDLTEEIIEFETALNDLVKYEFANESENLTYADNFQYFKLSEFQNIVPEIDWFKYFQITLNTTNVAQNLTIQTFILDTEFYTNLSDLMQRTSNETVAHYLMLKFLYYLNGNVPLAQPRNCIKYMRGYLPVFMNFLYEEYEFKDKRLQVEKKLNMMFNNLRHSFEEMVLENHMHLSKEEQKFILKELHTMQLKIGNLPRNYSEEYVDSHYELLKINPNDFVETHLNLLKFKNRLEYEKLSNAAVTIQEKFYNLDLESLRSSSPVKIFDNALLFPYGYLQMPLFDSQLDEVYQYSQMGFIMAHEIMHAFDLFHIIYDYKSNYNWLGSQLAQHYYPKLHCLGQGSVDVMSENLADISGLRIAYNFYKSLANNVPPSMLNITRDQLFFVNSVQFLCGDAQKIAELNGRLTDLSHDMHDTRVRQNWSKFEAFAVAFNCSPTSKMSPPEQSCRLW